MLFYTLHVYTALYKPEYEVVFTDGLYSKQVVHEVVSGI